MKRSLFLFVIVLCALQATAQEIQLHFDPSHSLYKDVDPRNYIMSRFQLFKMDKWGVTYGFIDFKFNQKKGNVGSAYMEIYRDIKIGNSPIVPHLEYNGGVGKQDNGSGFSIANAYLIGASYRKRFGVVDFNTYLVYKYNAFKKASNDFQWTASWATSVFNNKLTMAGYIDVWTENKNQETGKGGKKLIVMTEPQFWYNVDSHIAFGTQVEISNNFYAYYNKFYVAPTIAAKWTF